MAAVITKTVMSLMAYISSGGCGAVDGGIPPEASSAVMPRTVAMHNVNDAANPRPPMLANPNSTVNTKGFPDISDSPPRFRMKNVGMDQRNSVSRALAAPTCRKRMSARATSHDPTPPMPMMGLPQ